MRPYESWGRLSKRDREAHILTSRHGRLPADKGRTFLPFGNGRSYGDSCLNDEGALLDTAALDNFIAFDAEAGVLRCEAGCLLGNILDVIVPRGWFLPVVPGTKYVTVGGAAANDIHGKNHHRAGTFGRHIREIELLRSDGSRMRCSPDENSGMYKAAIGGLGLTGLILEVEIQLKRIPSPWIAAEFQKFSNLNEFLELSRLSDSSHEYTVAWVDSLAGGKDFGRGIFFRGNHTEREGKKSPPLKASVPFDLPAFVLSSRSLKLFNGLYYARHKGGRKYLTHYDSFFFPLDSIQHWNRMYGRGGFYQYQCIVPGEDGGGTLEKILSLVSRSGNGSFLSVVKRFGDIASPGLLSFPRKGITFAFDFPNRGQKTLDLFDRLDEAVLDAGGTVYPAKDARLTEEKFKRFYPAWKEFEQFKDPGFSSNFWRRVVPSR